LRIQVSIKRNLKHRHCFGCYTRTKINSAGVDNDMKLDHALSILCASFIGLFVLVSGASAQEPLLFRRAVELALAHSNEMALSHVDETHAYQTYLEARDSYFPKVAVGSNAGYAYGFPLSLEGSAPTLFNVTTQMPILNFAQQKFIKAAKAEWGATKSQSSDQRAQVMMDTALVYIELNSWESKVSILQSELKVAQNIRNTVAARVKEGIDPGIEYTKAELVEAQVRMRTAEAEGAVDVLRTRLSPVTGLPANSIKTERETIPPLKEDTPLENSVADSVQASAAIESAGQSALAKELRAKGEHRALLPSADFAAQYGLINTSLTNFQKFFVPGSFQPQNVTFAVVLRFPFLDLSQRHRAAAADAEALRARKEVEQTKNKMALDAVKLQHSVEQLFAARDVADLRSKLAQNELDAAHARMETETATQRELQDAVINSAERTLDRITADFEVARAEVQLLRSNGKLESWLLK
jgi:outer membrane protein TolC